MIRIRISKSGYQARFYMSGKQLVKGEDEKNIISESHYQELVQIATSTGMKIPKSLVLDFTSYRCRSFLGCYLCKMKNYVNGAMVLETVIHKPMTCEEDAWCLLDYAVCLYNLDGDEKMGLIRVNKVYNWAIQNEEQLMFLTIDEINRVIMTLRVIKRHKVRKRGRYIAKKS